MAAQAQPAGPQHASPMEGQLNCLTYLQWSTVLAKLQGGGQGADDHIPPELMLAALTTHGHVHIHTISHSAQPNILQRQS